MYSAGVIANAIQDLGDRKAGSGGKYELIYDASCVGGSSIPGFRNLRA
jgi:hypothetical protein